MTRDPRTWRAARSPSAGSTRAAGCSTRPRQVFGELGYHDASIVKLAEDAGVAAGTFYLYFDSKKAIFDELVRDLNRRVRHAMKEASSQGSTRLEPELLGFQAYFRVHAEHPALYRIIRQAEFVSPEMLRYHYDRLSSGYIEALAAASTRARSAARARGRGLRADGARRDDRHALDPLGRRQPLPAHVCDELERLIRCILEART